jgi:hypothetical protein
VEDARVFAVFRKWEETGELTREEAQVIREELNLFLDRGIGEVYQNIEQPERAFTLFTRLTSFLNVGIDRAPGIIIRLEGWVRTIQDLARRLAESLGADSYSIGISMPVGVSFDLSFNT